METIAALAHGRWFGALPLSLRAALVAAGRERRLDPGQWVYGEGDDETGLVGVIHGVLRLEVSAGPERDILLGLIGEGQVIGQSRRFGGGARIVTARAQGAARVLLIPDAALPAIAAREPDLWPAVVALLYDQLAAAVHGAALALALPPRARIAARLAELADAQGQVRVTQSDVAELAGLSRKSANGHLRALAALGLITLGYGMIRVHDAGRLRALAGLGPASQAAGT